MASVVFEISERGLIPLPLPFLSPIPVPFPVLFSLAPLKYATDPGYTTVTVT